VVLVLVMTVGIVNVVLPAWSRAQFDAVVAVAITQRTPVIASVARLLTDTPRVDEVVVAGQPTTLARPGGGGPWPAVVFVNGATRQGRYHPTVQRLARGLARAGFLVAVPDLPGLRLGEITTATTEAVVRVALAVAGRADVRGRRVSFYGVSVGATLSLLAAECLALAGRVRAVGGEAPWVDLEKVIRLATTGYYGPRPYPTDPYVRLAIARSLAARLPQASDRARLLSLLEAVPDDDPHPLMRLRAKLRLHPAGRALVSLLLNTKPARFVALYSRLPLRLRRGVRLLSPLLPREPTQRPRRAGLGAARSVLPAGRVTLARATVEAGPCHRHINTRPRDPGIVAARHRRPRRLRRVRRPLPARGAGRLACTARLPRRDRTEEREGCQNAGSARNPSFDTPLQGLATGSLHHQASANRGPRGAVSRVLER